jgi:hypothetical protein
MLVSEISFSEGCVVVGERYKEWVRELPRICVIVDSF